VAPAHILSSDGNIYKYMPHAFTVRESVKKTDKTYYLRCRTYWNFKSNWYM